MADMIKSELATIRRDQAIAEFFEALTDLLNKFKPVVVQAVNEYTKRKER